MYIIYRYVIVMENKEYNELNFYMNIREGTLKIQYETINHLLKILKAQLKCLRIMLFFFYCNMISCIFYNEFYSNVNCD